MNTIDLQDVENNAKRNIQLHLIYHQAQQSYEACRWSPFRCWQSIYGWNLV